MCHYLYIGSDCPLPFFKSDEKEPLLSITPLSEEEQPVLQHFSKKYVVYAGAYEGCSCGFNYDFSDVEDNSTRQEEELKKSCVVLLLQYIKKQLLEARSLEVYNCWAGELNEKPQARRTIDLANMQLGSAFWFEEKELVTFTDSSCPKDQ